MSETTLRLASFLDTAEADLADILERRELLAPLVLTLALSIWPTTQERFQRLRRQLIEAPPEVDERLLAVGLAGRELDVKLAGYQMARERVIAVKQQPPRPPAILRALFKSVLGWINKILGSLKAVFPPAEAIQEFKGFVEQ